MMKRILIFRGGAVGDFVVTLPVFRAIRRQWPDAHVEVAAYPRVAPLLLETGLAQRFHSLDGVEAARLFGKDDAGDTAELAEAIRRSDAVISYLNDPDNVVAGNLKRAGARRLVCVPPLPPGGRPGPKPEEEFEQEDAEAAEEDEDRRSRHVTDHLLGAMEELGVDVRAEDRIPRLEVPARGRKEGGRRLRDMGIVAAAVAIHPGSGSARKNWPAEKFAELAVQLQKDGRRHPFFILGEADGKAGAILRRTAPEVPVLENVGLMELAGVLSNCSVYAGNDSGVTHLAAALGIRTIALFGPSDPDVWGPRGDNVCVVRSPRPTPESLAEIEVEKVLHATGED